MHHRVVGDHADLSGAEEALGQRLYGTVEMGVPPDGDTVVAGEFEDRLLAPGDTLRLQAEPEVGGADVEDVGDRRVVQPGLQDLLRGGAEEVQRPGGCAGLFERGHQDLPQDVHRAQRRAARDPDHQGVAGEHRGGRQQHARQRCVLRRVGADDAVRLAADQHPAGALRELHVQLTGVELKVLLGVSAEKPSELPLRKDAWMLLLDQHLDDLRTVGLQPAAHGPAEREDPRTGGCGRPLRKCLGRRFHRRPGGRAVGHRAAGEHIWISRIPLPRSSALFARRVAKTSLSIARAVMQ